MTKLFQHPPWCFCCGMDNPGSLGVRWSLNGNIVLGHVVFTDTVQGGRPGTVHGGALAAVLDGALGAVPAPGGEPSRARVTAELTVRYRAPVSTGREVVVKAWAKELNERGFLAHATLAHVDEERERVVAAARLAFLDSRSTRHAAAAPANCSPRALGSQDERQEG